MQSSVNKHLKEKIPCNHIMITSAKVVDAEYEKMALQMTALYPNIDPFLLAKAAMLRKRNPTEKNRQHFWIDIHYNQGVNDNEKGPKLWKEAAIPPAYHGHNHFALDIQTDLEQILAISADRDIKMISGDVFPQ